MLDRRSLLKGFCCAAGALFVASARIGEVAAAPVPPAKAEPGHAARPQDHKPDSKTAPGSASRPAPQQNAKPAEPKKAPGHKAKETRPEPGKAAAQQAKPAHPESRQNAKQAPKQAPGQDHRQAPQQPARPR